MVLRSEVLRKEKNKKLIKLFIGIGLISLAFVFKYVENRQIEDINKNITDLNSIIVSDKEKEDKKVYLNLKGIPYKFAISDSTTDGYYIVSDGTYMYIAYMGLDDFNKLNKENIEARIEGITDSIPSDVKKLAIDTYNEVSKEKINMTNFNDYFGDICINLSLTDDSLAFIPFMMFLLSLILGIVVFIVGLLELIGFNRQIKKIGEINLEELDSEINDKNTIYYKKARVYLTKNYIINFNSFFRVIKYDDILWIYPYEQRSRGVKVAKSIKLLTNNFKTYNIANINILSKKSKQEYNEIYTNILSKNNNILNGYTKENIKLMKEKKKELKNK